MVLKTTIVSLVIYFCELNLILWVFPSTVTPFWTNSWLCPWAWEHYFLQKCFLVFYCFTHPLGPEMLAWPVDSLLLAALCCTWRWVCFQWNVSSYFHQSTQFSLEQELLHQAERDECCINHLLNNKTITIHDFWSSHFPFCESPLTTKQSLSWNGMACVAERVKAL